MSSHYAIAIDGPAASGKSTLARHLADRLGLIMVNTGAMYRAITWKALEKGLDPENRMAVADMLERIQIRCGSAGRFSTIIIDGVHPGEELRSKGVNASVSSISAIPEVRLKLIELQRQYLNHSSVVMEGRDIGSVVFPDTPYKIFVTADEAVRANRRRNDGEEDSISSRDAADSRRDLAPLTVPRGAVVLDNSEHTIESGVEAALEILRQQGLAID